MGQNGRLTTIEMSTDGGTTYAAIAATKESGISLVIETIDGTTKDDAGWTTLVDDVAIKSASITCSGLTKASNTSLEDWWDAAGPGTTLRKVQFVRPDGKTYTADFAMTAFDIGAPDGDANTFSATFNSSGVVTSAATV